MDTTQHIRPCRVAGAFYNDNAESLRQEIEARLANAPEIPLDGEIVSAAVPHAGYVYSADVAAPVFKAISRVDFDTIVIIGHDFGRMASGIIAILSDYTAFRTPLGDVPVDMELCQALQHSSPRVICNNYAHQQEHTIEVQLPFLQVTHPHFSVLPVLFGNVTEENCRHFTELLRKHRGNRKLFVLSSTDFSHYPTGELARQLDGQTLAYAKAFDLPGLCAWKNNGAWENLPNVETPICSAGGLGCAMLWAQKQGTATCVPAKCANSGDVSGDTTRVVGYTSMLFVKTSDVSENPTEPEKEVTTSTQKEADEPKFAIPQPLQVQLLKLAREVIRHGTTGKRVRPAAVDNELLNRPAAVFVTLHKQGRLRGCIGTTQAHLPMIEAIGQFAYAAAFQDPRFKAVTEEELPALHIEISVLSPMTRIADASEIRPGKNGVVIRKGEHSGLFLPQVWEQLPDMEQFMGYLCSEKAGLPRDAWKNSDAELYTFTVEAFSEE